MDTVTQFISWKIDRILKEKYPEIAAKVDKEIAEKTSRII